MALALTLGDPNGLGPELAVRLLPTLTPRAPVLIIGPAQSLLHHLERRGEKPFWSALDNASDIKNKPAGWYLHSPRELNDFFVELGQASPEGGRAAGLSLQAAVDLALSKKVEAVVTLPLNKAMLAAAGYPFPGHTEFLAQSCGLAPDEVVMHLCGDRLRVSLVTTHPPLRQVPDLITRPRVLRSIRLTAEFVRRLGVPGSIAVCGLNPHAGEGGTIGREELEVIVPAMEQARSEGIDVAGPFPADTVFYRAAAGEFSAVVAMYHDQGLGPLKTLEFHKVVNVTLGLPFVRTSVGHGTGYDLVGKDKAEVSSLAAALNLADRLVAGGHDVSGN